MGRFGCYETVSELNRTGSAVVYSGHAAGKPTEERAIKVFQPSALLSEIDQARADSALFLNSANVQQKVAAGSDQHWAPIHECGTTHEGAFYVTDKYDRSLQQLINGRVTLAASSLHVIIDSVVKGLVELKQVCGRPHGNLKAANVLISGSKVVLSDPLPDEHINAGVHWAADLRAVARLMYELITHRQAPRVDGWKAPDSEEWACLGRQADDWRNLCNRLLNVRVKPSTTTIETLVDELIQLGQAKSGIPPRWIVLTVITGLIVIACVVIFLILGRRETPAEQKDWENVCDEYIQWIEALDDSPKQSWEQDNELNGIREQIRNASYPREIARKRGSDVGSIRQEPEDPRGNSDKNAVDSKTKEAIKAIEEIKKFFNPKSDKPWPALIKIYRDANNFDEHDLKGIATYLRKMVNDMKFDPNIAKNVDKILELQRDDVLKNINISMDQIVEHKNTIRMLVDPNFAILNEYIKSEVSSKGKHIEDEFDILCKDLQAIAEITGQIASRASDIAVSQETTKNVQDPILNQFKDYVEQVIVIDTNEVSGDVLNMLASRLETTRSLAQKIVRSIGEIGEGKIRSDLFREYGKVYSSEELIETKLQYWLREVEDYREIGDPRDREIGDPIRTLRQDWKVVVETAYYHLDEVLKDKEFKKEKKDYVELERTKLDDCDHTFQNLPDILKPKNLYFIERDKIKIDSELQSLTKQRDTIRDFARVEFEKLETPGEWLAKVEQLQVTNSQVVHDAWTERRDRVLVGDTINKLRENDRATLHKVRPAINMVWGRLKGFGNFAEQLDQEFTNMLPQHEKLGIYNSELQDGYSKKRELVFQRIIDEFPQDQASDINDPASFKTVWRQELTTFRDDLVNFVNAFYQVHERFQAWHVIDDDQTTHSVAAFNRSFDTFRNENVFTQGSSTNNAFQELQDRIATLQDIQKEGRREELGRIAASETTHIEAMYTAWVRLGEFSKLPWPSEEEEWKIEEKIQKLLWNRFEEIEDIDRKEELREEFQTVFPEREIVFRKENTNRYIEDIDKNHTNDKILAQFPEFADNKLKLLIESKNLEELRTLETLAKKLGKYVISDDWRDEDIVYKTIFYELSTVHTDETGVINYKTFDDWYIQVKDYYFIPAPSEDDWGEIMDVNQALTDIIENAEEEDLQKLDFKNNFREYNVVYGELKKIQKCPPIKKNKEIIDGFDDLRTELLQIERIIRGIIKPRRFAPLNIWDGKIVFIEEKLLHLKPVLRKSAHKFETFQAENWEAIWDRNTEQFHEGFADCFVPEKVKATGRIISWPKYAEYEDVEDVISRLIPTAKSENGKSMIFRFIPADPPFYMAIYEITNVQYKAFLTSPETQQDKRMGGRAWDRFPPDGFTSFWTNSEQEQSDYPVTYVTSSEAADYASWIKAQLPTVTQHTFACKAGTTTLYPWGDTLQNGQSFAHLRGMRWVDAAKKHNEDCKSDTKKIRPPVGAVVPDHFTKTDPALTFEKRYTMVDSDLQDIAYGDAENDIYLKVWPIPHANEANDWGLYDMIGNVWEWCQDDNDDKKFVLCGGSCLAPTQYARPGYTYTPNIKTAFDVGFRVIVSVR